MRQAVDILSIPTRGRGLVEITRDVLNWLEPHTVQAGLLTLFCRHTSAGLLIQENAARDVRADLQTFFDGLAPEGATDIGTSTKAPATFRHISGRPHRCAAGDSDRSGAARLGNLARYLLVRTSACAPSA